MNSRIRYWRTAVLVLLTLALIGPWGFDRINVPAQYDCDYPNIRLYGDFCGIPIPGFLMLFGIASEFASRAFDLLTGAGAQGFTFPASMLFLSTLLLLLPFFTSFSLMVQGERRLQKLFNLAAFLLAGAICVLAVTSYEKLFAALWGTWLYIAVVVTAIVIESLLLAASAAYQ